MFGNKNNKKNNITSRDDIQEIKTKLDQDLFVRNMPTLNKPSKVALSGSASSSYQAGGGLVFKPNSLNNQHQKIGLLIILGGFILIGGLIYLSYVFIIKPFINPVGVVKAPLTNAVENNSIVEPIVIDELTIATSSEIIETNPTILNLEPVDSDIATNTMMAEEMSNFQNADWPSLLDTDGDGLIDDEEIVLGTNPNNADTNNNTYPDLLEILNNYNPLGDGSLENNQNLAWYKDSLLDYEILYPKDWEFSLLKSNQTLVFNAPDDSIIQISIQENYDKVDIVNWYGEMFPGQPLTYNKIKIKNTWEGMESLDSLNVYLTDNNKNYIYTISYIPAVTNRIVYPNIFKLMVNSLVIK